MTILGAKGPINHDDVGLAFITFSNIKTNQDFLHSTSYTKCTKLPTNSLNTMITAQFASDPSTPNLHAASHSCIAAHPIDTSRILPLALVVATPAMLLVEHGVHALTFAAYLRVPALVPAHPAVQPVGAHVHALLVATVRPGASLGPADPRVLVARQRGPQAGGLCKEPARASERSGWLQGFEGGRIAGLTRNIVFFPISKVRASSL